MIRQQNSFVFYPRTIMTYLYFKDIITYEDQVFVSEILCLAQSFKIIDQPIYLWRIFEPDTLGKKSGYVVVISCIKIIYEIGKFFEKENR